MDKNPELLKLYELLLAGDRIAAKKLLGQMIEANPEDKMARSFLISLMDDPEAKRRYLEAALNKNPKDYEAKDELKLLNLDIQAAYEELFSTRAFLSAAIGFDGETPLVVEAFRVVLLAENAADLFRGILENGSLAGQLYALCGLYAVDRPFFLEAVESYRSLSEKVQTMSGCIGNLESVSEIIPRIENGESTDDFCEMYGENIREKDYVKFVSGLKFRKIIRNLEFRLRVPKD